MEIEVIKEIQTEEILENLGTTDISINSRLEMEERITDFEDTIEEIYSLVKKMLDLNNSKQKTFRISETVCKY